MRRQARYCGFPVWQWRIAAVLDWRSAAFELVDDVGVRLVDVFRRIDQSAYLLIGGADGSGYRAHALVGLCCGLAQQA